MCAWPSLTSAGCGDWLVSAIFLFKACFNNLGHRFEPGATDGSEARKTKVTGDRIHSAMMIWLLAYGIWVSQCIVFAS